MNNKRIEEIQKSIPAGRKATYTKAEALPECRNIEDQMVRAVFAEDHAEYGNFRMYDVLNHFKLKNEELGHVADEELACFETECHDFVNEIKGRASGERGEQKVFGTLENLKGEHRVLKNVELTETGDERTEIDAVVITPKALFIVEVKNTGRDVFIDERGDYYRVGRYNSLDCHLGEKMECRERMLRNALRNQGITKVNIEKVVVFTNNQIQIANEYKGLDVCFLGQICYRINSYTGVTMYSSADITHIEDAIEAERSMEEYPLDIDVEKLKYDFAVLMATLEGASGDEEESEPKISEEHDEIHPNPPEAEQEPCAKHLRYAIAAATVVATFTLATTTLLSMRRR